MKTLIRELESEQAQWRHFQKSSTICTYCTFKELTFVHDKDQKNYESLQALIDQLQGKGKTYNKQIRGRGNFSYQQVQEGKNSIRFSGLESNTW